MILLSALSSAGLTIRRNDPSGIVLYVDDSEGAGADEAYTIAERHGWASSPPYAAGAGCEIILTPPELDPEAEGDYLRALERDE